MRALLAVAAMIGGAVIFCGNPATFSHINYTTVPGTMIAGTFLFVWGILLWLRSFD